VSDIVVITVYNAYVCISLVKLVMATLRNKAGRYIFALRFLSFYLSTFFPRLISAAVDWMSAILPHMMWP